HLLDAIIAGLLGGIIGARLYYVIFYPGDKYITNPMEIFNIKEGGLGIYGGIIGGLLCGGIVAKIRKMNLFAVLDVASLGYLIGQGVGRWGNFVNQEAFGCATDLPWGMYSDRTAAEVVGNVHPCFLYESILCLLGFVLLHLFTRHLRRYDGQTFLLYIIWYGVTRFFIEGLRTDSLLLPGIDLRVSQVLAAASALVAVVLLIVFRNCHKLTGCGSRKAMEAAGLTVEDKAEKVEIDDTAESTIFSGMSAEEAQEHMTVGTGVKKTAEAENEKTEGNADANTSEEPSDEAEEANETAEGESEEKNDGSEN
ncbi:prolipoprotein diacylglyceryl transferase, partial [Hominenteromicrobium sp.]